MDYQFIFPAESKPIQKINELQMLLNLLEKERIETVLEIGTDYGGTAMIWAKCVSHCNGLVVTVDLNPPPVLPLIYLNTVWKKYIFEVYGDSHQKPTVRKVREALDGRKVDFLFIDGDHSKEGVKKDFYFYAPLVREEGLIAFHDIRDTEFHRNLPAPYGPVEVCDFWKMIKGKYMSWEFLDPYDDTCMGIGVIRWRTV